MRQVEKYFDAGRDGASWYESERPILESIFGDDTETFAGFLAATSANATVKANATLAVKAYDQWKRGEPFNGFLPTVIGNLERAAAGEPLSGPKVEPFRRALLGDSDAVVVDRWMFRAFDTKDRDEVEQGIRTLAADYGVTPAEFQAGVWCGVKRDYEGSDTDVSTCAEQVRERMSQLTLL